MGYEHDSDKNAVSGPEPSTGERGAGDGKKLTRDSLKTSEDRIAALTRQLGVTIDQVLEGSVPRREENEQALLDLEGELELRRTLQETLRHLEQLEVCR